MTEAINATPNMPEKKSASDYLHHARQWESSGLQQTAYCNIHGLNYSRFTTARGKLSKSLHKKEKTQETSKLFVPIRTIQKEEKSSVSPTKPDVLRIHFPRGGILEIPDHMEMMQLAQLFKAMEEIL